MHKAVFLLLGYLSLAAGVIGLLLPVVPTTPFIVVAAYCFSRGSARMHQWILNQPHFGPIVRDWETYGVIPPRIKLLATVLIIGGMVYPIGFMPIAIGLKITAVVLALGGLTFIWTRPSVRCENRAMKRRAARAAFTSEKSAD